MRRLVRHYAIFWLLLIGCLTSVSIAALLFQFADHHEFEFIVAALLQVAGVLLALALAYLFFEQRAQTRQRRIDETVESSVALLRGIAVSAVITTTGELWDKPDGHDSYGSNSGEKVYQEARRLVLERPHDLADYRSDVHGFGSLEWVFRMSERVALNCRQMIETIEPGLVEFGALLREMVNFESRVVMEKQVWDEFRVRLESRQIPMPAEAIFNLSVIAELTVRLIDVLDSKNYRGDPEYEAIRKFNPEVFWRGDNWGSWRRPP